MVFRTFSQMLSAELAPGSNFRGRLQGVQGRLLHPGFRQPQVTGVQAASETLPGPT